MLSRFRRENPARAAADRLHAAVAARAREPIFYTAFGVPDTVDGRFDLLALHAFIALESLKGQGEAGNDVATHLTTALFGGFEDALRDLGVSDFGLSRRIKAMADAFYGRLEHYAAAADGGALAAAIVRNLYRGDEGMAKRAAVLAHYVIAARSKAAESALADGVIDFGALPEF